MVLSREEAFSGFGDLGGQAIRMLKRGQRWHQLDTPPVLLALLVASELVSSSRWDGSAHGSACVETLLWLGPAGPWDTEMRASWSLSLGRGWVLVVDQVALSKGPECHGG